MNAVRPGCERCHTPHAGSRTGSYSAWPGVRWSRSKRIHIRSVPAIAGIRAVNVAVREAGVGPVVQLTSRAASGWRSWAGAAGAAASGAARQAIVASRRMGPLNSRGRARLRAGRRGRSGAELQVTW